MEQSINDHVNDEVIYRAKLHWSYGLIAKIWGGLILLTMIPLIFIEVPDKGSIIASYIFFLTPTIITLLNQRNFDLYITKNRIVLEGGAFSRKTRYIPLTKVNDIIVEKSPFFSSGNISILTGNEKAKPIKTVKDPEAFRDKLYEAINSLNKKGEALR